MRKIIGKITAVLVAVAMITSVSEGYSLNGVKADEETILTTSEITIVGFQMKTTPTEEEGVTFRTIYTAPNIGSEITVNDSKYIVNNVGVVYTKDSNTSGNHEDNVLDDSYTILKPTPYVQPDVKEGNTYKYIGKKSYEGYVVTFGFLATENGAFETKDGYTSYVMSMTKMDAMVTNSLYVRAFIEATDEEGNDAIIYSEANTTSVAEIAYNVYIEGKAPSAEGHKYLYDTILNKLPENNPYYKNTEEEYGWSGIVKP